MTGSERLAWDMYVSAYIQARLPVAGNPNTVIDEPMFAEAAGTFADTVLEQRRKRFSDT